MAWIKIIDEASADGILARVYKTGIARAGRVANIIKVQSLNAPVVKSSMTLYTSIMHQPSPLSRAQREMIATVVSRANDCHY